MNRNPVPHTRTLTLRKLTATAATAAAVVVGCCCFYGTSAAPARAQAGQQAGSDGVVTGSGRVALTRQPNVLRMTMQVRGEGKDIKEALAKLKSEREAVAAKLKTLGAAQASVKFDGPRVGGGPGDPANAARQRAMQMQRAMRARAGGRVGAAKPEPEPKVEVTSKVTAEWSFEPGETPEDLIVNAYTLREKVKAGGLSKKAAKAELTPEEQEEMEEAEGMVMDVYDGMPQAATPGEPVFVFVSKVPAAERDAATAEAFKKAKAEAARLASAGGAQLGEIRQVTGQTASVTDDSDDANDFYNGGYQYQAQVMRQLGLNVPGTNAEEAAGFEPGPVALQVMVTATFAIK